MGKGDLKMEEEEYTTEIVVKEDKYNIFMDKFSRLAPELYEEFTKMVMVQWQEMIDWTVEETYNVDREYNGDAS